MQKIVTQEHMDLKSGSDTDEVLAVLKRPRKLSLSKSDNLNDSLPTFVRMSSHESMFETSGSPKVPTKIEAQVLTVVDGQVQKTKGSVDDKTVSGTKSLLTQQELLKMRLAYVSLKI